MASYASVSLSFPLNGEWANNQKLIEKTMKKFNGTCGDSGAGFGMRDMNWSFLHYDDAVLAENAIKELNITGLEING
jgi:hypothetical protein